MALLHHTVHLVFRDERLNTFFLLVFFLFFYFSKHATADIIYLFFFVVIISPIRRWYMKFRSGDRHWKMSPVGRGQRPTVIFLKNTAQADQRQFWYYCNQA